MSDVRLPADAGPDALTRIARLRQTVLRLHHVCWVVPDMSRATQQLEATGIGPWRDYPPLEEYVELDVPDRAAFLGLTYKSASTRGAELQLVQPGPHPTPQRRWLEARGTSLFHLGFEVQSIDKAVREAVAAGFDPVMQGRRQDGSGFAYFDVADLVGSYVVLRQSRAVAVQE